MSNVIIVVLTRSFKLLSFLHLYSDNVNSRLCLQTLKSTLKRTFLWHYVKHQAADLLCAINPDQRRGSR